MAAKNTGLPYGKEVSFTAYDYLVYTNRNTGGKDYRALENSLERLKGTMLKTNIKTGNEEQIDIFGLIDKARIRRKSLDGRVIEWGVTLSDWLFNAIEANQVLTLNPKYFHLRRPLERRLYEIVGKHCGTKQEWRIGIDTLQKKCGSTATRRKFRFMISDICKHQHLPDYQIKFDDEKKDILVITSKDKSLELDLPRLELKLKTQTYENAKKILSTKRLDAYDIEAQWLDWMKGKMPPENSDAAFIGFCKRKVS